MALVCIFSMVPPAVSEGVLSSATLARIVEGAPWAEPLGYSDMPRKEAFEKACEDNAKYRRMAAHARDHQWSLQTSDAVTVEQRRRELEVQTLAGVLLQNIQFPPEQIQHVIDSRGWLRERPARMLVSYIFIDTTGAGSAEEVGRLKARADRVRAELNDENFPAMARMWSDAPSSLQGGSLGIIAPEEMGPTFRQHLEATPTGEIGGPYQTASGWNILWVRDRMAAEGPRFTPDEARDAAREVLAAAEANRVFNEEPALARQVILERADPETLASIDEEIAFQSNYFLTESYLWHLALKQEITEADLRQEWETLPPTAFPPRRRVSEILLRPDDWTEDHSREAWEIKRRTRDEARHLRQAILAGDIPFSEAARRHSAGSTAAEGGELGWVRSPYHPDYDNALLVMEPGDVSIPLVTRQGVAILQLHEVDAAEAPGYEDSRQTLEQRVLHRRYRQAAEEIEKLVRPGAGDD